MHVLEAAESIQQNTADRHTMNEAENAKEAENLRKNQPACVIVGASHAGVNCAFELRKQGFEGQIVVIDTDKHLPYHRPPLSKAYLNTPVNEPPPKLKSEQAYANANITLMLGVKVTGINTQHKVVDTQSVDAPFTRLVLAYTHLVLATGASPIIPPINGLKECISAAKAKPLNNILVMRNADDAIALKAFINQVNKPISAFHALVVGAGYIGLEAAASLRKLGGKVTVIEREHRPLARVASEEVSQFVSALHSNHGVKLICNDSVTALLRTPTAETDNGQTNNASYQVLCESGAHYHADCLLIGVGVTVNNDLAQSAGLQLDKSGIRVDGRMQTSNPHIWAIGDCTVFAHQEYGDNTHIESVQNALEQAKVAAQCIAVVNKKNSQSTAGSALAGMPCTPGPSNNEAFSVKAAIYKAIPWFWSDQFNSKLQIAGLTIDTDKTVVRVESESVRSIWHFNGNVLRCVEAINSPKAYVLGSKWIAQQRVIDKAQLADASVSLTSLSTS